MLIVHRELGFVGSQLRTVFEMGYLIPAPSSGDTLRGCGEEGALHQAYRTKRTDILGSRVQLISHDIVVFRP